MPTPEHVPVDANARRGGPILQGGSDDEDEPLTHFEEYKLEIKKYIDEIKSTYASMYSGDDAEEKKNKFRNDTNPLEWWYQRRKEFPMLHKLAERILEMSAQSACSERMFSALALLVTKARSTIERNLAGCMVTNYMRSRRKSKPSKSTLPFPLFGRDFPVDNKTRATLLTPENDADEAEDVDQPDNLDEFLQHRDGVQHTDGVDHEPPFLEEENEDFMRETIYPDSNNNDNDNDNDNAPENTTEGRRRGTRLDYFMMQNGRRR